MPWYDELPDYAKEWEEVKKSDTPEAFYEQVKNMRVFLGDSIRIPGKDAGETDLAAFHAKMKEKVPTLMETPDLTNEEAMNRVYGSLGRPETAEGYEVKDDLGLSKMAHKHGLSKVQFANMVADMTTANTSAQADVSAAHKTALGDLKTEWGDAYEQRVALATTVAVLTDAPDAVVKALKDGTATASDYKWMHSVASKFKGEGMSLLTDHNDQAPSTTPAQAQEQINEIRNNKEHPYWHKGIPGNKEAIKRMTELYELKAAG